MGGLVGGMGEVMMSVCVCSQSSSNQMYKKFTLQNNCIYATPLVFSLPASVKERRTVLSLSRPGLLLPLFTTTLTHLKQKLAPAAHHGNQAQKPINGEEQNHAHPPLRFCLCHVPARTRRTLTEIRGQGLITRGEHSEVAPIERGVPDEAEDDVDEEGDGGVYGPVPLLNVHDGGVRGLACHPEDEAQGHDGAKVEEEGEAEEGEEDALVQGDDVRIFHNLGHGLARRPEPEEGLFEEVDCNLSRLGRRRTTNGRGSSGDIRRQRRRRHGGWGLPFLCICTCVDLKG